MPPDPSVTQIIQWLSGLGAPGVLALVCYFWFTGKLVTQREFQAALDREREWRELALRSLGNTERATATAERAASTVAQVVQK